MLAKVDPMAHSKLIVTIKTGTFDCSRHLMFNSKHNFIAILIENQR